MIGHPYFVDLRDQMPGRFDRNSVTGFEQRAGIFCSNGSPHFGLLGGILEIPARFPDMIRMSGRRG